MSGVPLKCVTNKMMKTIKLKKNFLREIRVDGKEEMKASNKTSAKQKISTWWRFIWRGEFKWTGVLSRVYYIIN